MLLLLWSAYRHGLMAHRGRSSTAYPSWRNFRRRPLPPIWHLHFAVHLHRDGEVLLGLPKAVSAAMQFAEA
jgi:hypothetical protein